MRKDFKSVHIAFYNTYSFLANKLIWQGTAVDLNKKKNVVKSIAKSKKSSSKLFGYPECILISQHHLTNDSNSI